LSGENPTNNLINDIEFVAKDQPTKKENEDSVEQINQIVAGHKKEIKKLNDIYQEQIINIDN